MAIHAVVWLLYIFLVVRITCTNYYGVVKSCLLQFFITSMYIKNPFDNILPPLMKVQSCYFAIEFRREYALLLIIIIIIVN